MRVDTIRKLFAGVRIDGRMREQLDKCPQRDRVFFESPEGKYLTVLRGGDDTYLGKVIDPAAPLNGIEDVRRNVWSIIQRICPGRRDESEVKLYALDDSEVEPTFSSSGRGRSGGPISGPGSSGMGSDRGLGRSGGFDDRSGNTGNSDEDDYF